MENDSVLKNRKRVAEWAAKNPDMVRAKNDRWKAKNQEKMRVYRRNRKDRQRGAVGKLSSGLPDKLFKLQKGFCACGCGKKLGSGYHLDHIMPLSLGGANEDWNIQLLTPECNMKKCAKHPVDFMQEQGFLI